MYKRQDDIKALIQEQKQTQEQTAAELGLLRGELNKQVTKISEVQESMTLKIAEIEKSVSIVEEWISTKISAVENSMANIREQIKSEVEQFLKIQPKQISEQTVPVIKTEKDRK